MIKEKHKGALILTHVQAEGSCMLGRTLNERGLNVKTLNVPRIDMREIDPLRPDLLVVMGGPIGVYQVADYPFIAHEIEILKTRLQADLPTIGICFGAQLMAAALGQKVYPGNIQELGWNPLSITPEGMNTPARHFAPDKTSMFHWHGDTFDLPPQAKLLASSSTYQNQIFQIGQHGIGLQCHPEVRRERLKEWEVMFVSQVTGPNASLPLSRWRAETDMHIEALNKQAALFFNEWLEEREF